MSPKLRASYRAAALTLLILSWVGGSWSCSTEELAPKPVPAITPPEYVSVPHPSGYSLGDLRALFNTAKAPSSADLKDCDAPFLKLRGLTDSIDEIRQGARELVRQDPARMHWCFYGKLVELENLLRTEPYIDVRQKAVLKAYSFLVPVAKAYIDEYHDSRYLRWAIRHYRGISEWVFFRKLDLGPQMTSELVEAANPFGIVREDKPQKPILEKYGIVKTEVPETSMTASGSPAAAGAPAGAPDEESPFALLDQRDRQQAQQKQAEAAKAAAPAPAATRAPASDSTFSATDGPAAEPAQQ